MIGSTPYCVTAVLVHMMYSVYQDGGLKYSYWKLYVVSFQLSQQSAEFF